MSTQILDVSSLKICISILDDEFSLRRQFIGQAEGNDQNLEKAYSLLSPPKRQVVEIKMALVEAESLVGSHPQEIVDVVSDALKIPLSQFVTPSLSQIGSLAFLFRHELNIQRVVPILRGDNSICLMWKRSTLTGPTCPVLRIIDAGSLHGQLWVMVPILGK